MFCRSVAALALAAFVGVANAQEKIRLAILSFSESLGAVIADKQGFFKAEGLEVEMTKFNAGALALPVLQSGKIDISLNNTISTLQAIEQGLDLMLVAPSAVARATAPDSTTAVMFLKGTISSAKDLEGKRVAVNVVNSTAWLYLVAMLEKRGADRTKIRYVEVPFPQMNDPLLNKQVDAIGQVEPFRSVLMDSGKVDILGFTYPEVQPNADVTQYIALTAWARKNPETVKKFARAITKGSEFANANEAATRTINQEFTNLNPALKDRVTLPRFGTTVNTAEVRKTAELMVKYGMLKQPIDVASRVMAP